MTERSEVHKAMARLRTAYPHKAESLGNDFANELFQAFKDTPPGTLLEAVTTVIQGAAPMSIGRLKEASRNINGSRDTWKKPEEPKGTQDTSDFSDLWSQGRHPVQLARSDPEAFQAWYDRERGGRP